MEWFVLKNGDVLGPYTTEGVTQSFASTDVLIWGIPCQEWLSYSDWSAQVDHVDHNISTSSAGHSPVVEDFAYRTPEAEPVAQPTHEAQASSQALQEEEQISEESNAQHAHQVEPEAEFESKSEPELEVELEQEQEQEPESEPESVAETQEAMSEDPVNLTDSLQSNKEALDDLNAEEADEAEEKAASPVDSGSDFDLTYSEDSHQASQEAAQGHSLSDEAFDSKEALIEPNIPDEHFVSPHAQQQESSESQENESESQENENEFDVDAAEAQLDEESLDSFKDSHALVHDDEDSAHDKEDLHSSAQAHEPDAQAETNPPSDEDPELEGYYSIMSGHSEEDHADLQAVEVEASDKSPLVENESENEIEEVIENENLDSGLEVKADQEEPKNENKENEDQDSPSDLEALLGDALSYGDDEESPQDKREEASVENQQEAEQEMTAQEIEADKANKNETSFENKDEEDMSEALEALNADFENEAKHSEETFDHLDNEASNSIANENNMESEEEATRLNAVSDTDEDLKFASDDENVISNENELDAEEATRVSASLEDQDDIEEEATRVSASLEDQDDIEEEATRVSASLEDQDDAQEDASGQQEQNVATDDYDLESFAEESKGELNKDPLSMDALADSLENAPTQGANESDFDITDFESNSQGEVEKDPLSMDSLADSLEEAAVKGANESEFDFSDLENAVDSGAQAQDAMDMDSLIQDLEKEEVPENTDESENEEATCVSASLDEDCELDSEDNSEHDSKDDNLDNVDITSVTELAQLKDIAQKMEDRKKEEEAIWYIAYEGEVEGPETESQVFKKIDEYEVKDFIYLWKEGFADWKNIFDIPGFSANLGIGFRRHNRIEVSGTVSIEFEGNMQVGQLNNLSESGLGVTGLDDLDFGDIVKVKVDINDLEDEIEVVAKVRFISETGLVGLSYEKDKYAENVTKILDYLEGQVEKAAA